MDKDRNGEPRAAQGGLFSYFALTFGLTWTSWVVAAVLVNERRIAGPFDSPLTTILVVLGIGAPALSALAVTVHRGGWGSAGPLLRQLVRWRHAARWYAFAVGYIVAVKLAAAIAYRIVEGAWPVVAIQMAPLLLAATVFSTLSGGQVGEELGWRGYALPRLEARVGLGPGALLLGVLWAVWHLPLFYMPGADTYGQSFPLYAIQVTGLSVAVAWLYHKTRGSLLPVMLMHASFNNLKGIVPGVARPAGNPLHPDAQVLGWLTALMIWVAAVYLLTRLAGPDRTRDGRRIAMEQR
jgi:uncharacterized protein